MWYNHKKSARKDILMKKIEKLDFYIKKYIFQIKGYTSEKYILVKNHLGMLFTFITLLSKIVLYIFALLFFNKMLDYYFSKYLNIFYQNYISSFDREIYYSALSTLLGVVGIFLGFYLSNLNNTLSNIYSQLPNNFKKLFWKKEISSSYLNQILIYLAIVIFILGNAVLKNDLPLLFPLVLIYSFYILNTCINLSKKLLEYSKPVTFLEIIFKEVYKNLDYLSVDGYQFNSIHFQNYYIQNIENLLDMIKHLCSNTLENQNSNKNDYITLLYSIEGLHFNYLKIKSKIPTKSLGYKETIKYKSYFWGYEPHTYYKTLVTPTNLKETTRDNFWLEKFLLKLEMSIIKNKTLPFDLKGQFLINCSENLYRNNKIINPKIYEEHYSDLIDLALNQLPRKVSQIKDNEVLMYIDSCNYLTFSLVESTSNRIIELYDNFKKIIQKIDFLSDNIYSQNMPIEFLEVLENLKIKLENEFRVCKKIITPKSYIEREFFHKLLKVSEETISSFIKLLIQAYYLKIKIMDEKEHYLFSLASLSRFYSCCDFTLDFITKIDSISSELKNDFTMVEIKEFDLKTKEKKDLIKLIISNSESLLRNSLKNIQWKNYEESIPDYFGWGIQKFQTIFYDNISQKRKINYDDIKLLIDLAEKQKTFIMENYRPYYENSYNNYAKIRLSLEGYEDLMLLIGYSILYSEFYNISFDSREIKELLNSSNINLIECFKVNSQFTLHYSSQYNLSNRKLFSDSLKSIIIKENYPKDIHGYYSIPEDKPLLKSISGFFNGYTPKEDYIKELFIFYFFNDILEEKEVKLTYVRFK